MVRNFVYLKEVVGCVGAVAGVEFGRHNHVAASVWLQAIHEFAAIVTANSLCRSEVAMGRAAGVLIVLADYVPARGQG